MVEADLLAQYRRTGDMKLLGDIYAPYMSLVYGFCYKYFQDDQRSQDAVMNIFEELVVKLRRHSVENFRSWLYSVARNYCLMQLRKEKGRIQVDIDSYQSEIELYHIQGDAEEENQEELQALQECLNSLKEDQKAAVDYFYNQKMCYEDIAAEMGVDHKKVKSLIQNGRRNLKICMERKNYGK